VPAGTNPPDPKPTPSTPTSKRQTPPPPQVAAANEYEGAIKDLLATGEFKNEAELDKYIAEAHQQIEKVQAAIAAATAAELAAAAGEGCGDGGEAAGAGAAAARGGSEAPMEVEEADPPPPDQPRSDQDLYPLLGIPDADLTEDQKKEKRRQQSMKASAEGRARAAAKREERARAAAERTTREDGALASDPALYIGLLRQRYAEAAARAEARKRRKLGLPAEGASARGGRRMDVGKRWVFCSTRRFVTR
jgi:hypothetical protein